MARSGRGGAREYTLKVFRDVKRYDIDGVHIDDYLSVSGGQRGFSGRRWQRYQKSGVLGAAIGGGRIMS
jgi:uncharacterized lipoprotein YddW (UPF0748 family)